MNTKKEIETKEERKILDYICAYGRVYLHELKSEFEELHVNYIEEIVKYLQTQGFVKEEVIKRPLVKGKVLPKGFDTNSVVNIYGNKTAIFLWEGKSPTAFVIDNKDVADSFRKWFDLIYEKI